ncbi:Putative secreted protein [Gryllus bimaculatus]|nr:Putative secreted protein [Gryllus bimaculatus]
MVPQQQWIPEEQDKWQIPACSFCHNQLIGVPSAKNTTAKGVKNQETLQTSALVSKFTDTVQNQVHNFLANSVVTTCIVVSSILFSITPHTSYQRLTNNCRLQVYEYCTRDVFPCASFHEEGVEGVVTTSQVLPLYTETDGWMPRRLKNIFLLLKIFTMVHVAHRDMNTQCLECQLGYPANISDEIFYSILFLYKNHNIHTTKESLKVFMSEKNSSKEYLDLSKAKYSDKSSKSFFKTIINHNNENLENSTLFIATKGDEVDLEEEDTEQAALAHFLSVQCHHIAE